MDKAIHTSRFGPIQVDAAAVIRFPAGLLGLEDCRQWALVADHQNEAVAWMQSVEQPEIALAVVSPRRFVPGYRVRVARRELASLELDDVRTAEVLAILSKQGQILALNLRAPLVFNLQRRLARQVIANGDLPVQFGLGGSRSTFRRSA